MKTQRLAKVRFVARVGLVGIAGLAFPGMAFPADNDASPTITVQIYNYSLASPTVLVGAEREAGRILRMAGLRAVWLECPIVGIARRSCTLRVSDADVRVFLAVRVGHEGLHLYSAAPHGSDREFL